VLKDESINKHRVWIAAGRPNDGPVAKIMRKARQEYKLHFKKCVFQSNPVSPTTMHGALSDLALAFVASKFHATNASGMLGRSSGNHDWLLANASACVSCGFRLRNARNASDCV